MPSVGYRVNSKRATAFRQWATGVLRDKAQPLGVAEYQLVESLLPELQSSLPSIEQIECELAGAGFPEKEEEV